MGGGHARSLAVLDTALTARGSSTDMLRVGGVVDQYVVAAPDLIRQGNEVGSAA